MSTVGAGGLARLTGGLGLLNRRVHVVLCAQVIDGVL